MSLSWTLCQLLGSERPSVLRAAQLQPGEIISFGTENDCDVKIQTSRSIVSVQLLVGEYFCFLVEESAVETVVSAKRFSIEGSRFELRKDDFRESSSHWIEERTPAPLSPENLILFRDLILAVQSRRLEENHEAFAGGDAQNTLVEAARLLDKSFWGEHDPFSPADRQLHEDLLWLVCAAVHKEGILTPLFNDASVSEIMVNGPNKVFVERMGRLELTDFRFPRESDLLSLIERLVAQCGRRIDESQPSCDARLADGSRLHAIIPPLSLNGPTLTIRRFPRNRLGSADLVKRGALPEELLVVLEELVAGRESMLISGGTGAGKTTLLNVLSSFIPDDERIITIEDSAELQLQKSHVVRLEARNANLEGRGGVSLRELVRHSLRMRPDRIIVGECRGAEAFDMLQAMNTGHEGSMTTVHANSPRDALRRVETLVLMAGMDLPLRAIRELVVSGIRYVIQQERLVGGARKVTKVLRVLGLEGPHQDYVTEDVVRFDSEKETWTWE